MKSSPCAVKVVLTLAAASGDSGGIEPEGRPAVPIAAALISIITVKTTKHIHTVPDQYQHAKRDILSYSVFQIPLLSISL